jgi:hypothetical protein
VSPIKTADESEWTPKPERRDQSPKSKLEQLHDDMTGEIGQVHAGGDLKEILSKYLSPTLDAVRQTDEAFAPTWRRVRERFKPIAESVLALQEDINKIRTQADPIVATMTELDQEHANHALNAVQFSEPYPINSRDTLLDLDKKYPGLKKISDRLEHKLSEAVGLQAIYAHAIEPLTNAVQPLLDGRTQLITILHETGQSEAENKVDQTRFSISESFSGDRLPQLLNDEKPHIIDFRNSDHPLLEFPLRGE